MSKPFRHWITTPIAGLGLVVSALVPGACAHAQFAPESGALPAPLGNAAAMRPAPEIAGQTYADLVDLALASPVVLRATVRRQVKLGAADSPGLMPGFVRVYIEADTSGVLVGPTLGESVRFLADLRLDPNGKMPKVTKSQVLLFGNAGAGKPGELQLTAPDTMFAWSPELETKVRAILAELVNDSAPPVITGLREALHVPGNLVGEGETQFFFTTKNARPVSISVLRRPGEPPRWGVSFGEIVDQAARPPTPETLAWYRLACEIPRTLPDAVSISADPADRAITAEDYALVLHDLGPCQRNRVAHQAG